MKKIKIVLLSLFASGCFISFGALTVDYFEVSKNLDILATLYREVNMYYVDDVVPGDLMKTGIDAMLESLDPYTNFISEADIEDYEFMTTGQYGGIGALIRTNGDFVIISEPYENFPAHKAGLRAGDKIVEVDGKSAKGKKTEDISKILKGEPGTSVTIMIERGGESELLEKNLVREEIKVSSVPYFGMLNDSVGYIKLNSFTSSAGKEVKEALNDLKTNKKANKVILDLRDNPGGLLREAVNIVNLFVEKNMEVVSTKGKVKEWEKSHRTINFPVTLDMQVAILVSPGSASASEIVSGALQDFDRGIVVGQQTFGKGLVQTTRPLSYNTQLKITTAKYYIPSGRCIQARDYSHKEDDGSVKKMPDSLKTAFYTSNGRTVYDGIGIEPDVYVAPKEVNKITISLLTKNLIFDFVTGYVADHETISSPETFVMTDEEWADFLSFVSDKDYDYETQSEKTIKKLKKIAEKENYFENMSDEYENLIAKLHHDKKGDIEKYKDEIREFIEMEIVSRYYLQKGRIQYNLRNDEEVASALNILSDTKTYKGILDGSMADRFKEKSKPESDEDNDDDDE